MGCLVLAAGRGSGEVGFFAFCDCGAFGFILITEWHFSLFYLSCE